VSEFLLFCSHGDVIQVGLWGCGMMTAYSLAHAGYGDDLLDADLHEA